MPSALELFSAPAREWFSDSFEAPTEVQERGWRAVAGGQNTLMTAPTGSGKTLAAFLWCLDRLAGEPQPPAAERRPPDSEERPLGDHRRDPLGGGDQARRPPRHQPRAALRAHRVGAAANPPLRHPAAARRGRP